MRKLHGGVLILALGLLSPQARAADDLDPALLATPDCPTEPGCPALILRDEMLVNNQSGQARMSYRRAIKVFTAEGADRWANVNVTAVAGSFNIRNLEGSTVLPDGKRIRLDQDNIQVKTAFRMGGTRVIMKSALFPGVVPGAVLDYRYDLISEGAGDFVGFQWDIQTEVPVLRSDLVLKHGGVKFAWLQVGREPLRIAEEHPFPNVYLFHALNVPSVPAEPFGPSPEVWRSRMFFHRPAARQLWLSFHGGGLALQMNQFMLKKKLLAEKLKSLRREGDSTAQTIGAVYRFVQQTIASAGDSRSPEQTGADDVLAAGRGNGLQRTMLFVALLNQAGFESALVAVAGRDHATLDTSLPDPSQFNAFVAAVHEGNRWSFYDPATRYCPLGMVAAPLENVFPNAIIAMPGAGMAKDPVVIPVSPAARNLLSRDVMVTLQPDGSAIVEARDEGQGLSDLDHRERYERLPDPERREALETWLHRTLPLARVESATFENLESFTGKARILYRFVLPGMAAQTDGTLMINPSVLHGSQAVPFTAETRRTPVDFGHAVKTVERIAFTVPAGYRVQTLPEPVVLRDGPLSLITSCVVMEGEVVFTRRLEIDAATWAAEEYPRLKAFFEKVQDADRQSLVLAREGA